MSNIQLVTVDSLYPEVVLQTPGVQGPAGVAGFFEVAGTTHTLLEINRSKIGRFTSADSITITIPAGLSANYDCLVLQLGEGKITFEAGAGVTLRSALSANKTAYRYAAASIICIGADEFLLTGEVTA